MPLSSEQTTVFGHLMDAILDEERARKAARLARERQVAAIEELRRSGLPVTAVASRVAHARGENLAVEGRLRFAERLRKRARRGTRCPLEMGRPHGLLQPDAAPSDQAAISPPVPKENTMPQILKRTTTTTEEFLQPDELDGLEPSKDEIDLEEFEDPEEKKGSPVRRRHR